MLDPKWDILHIIWRHFSCIHRRSLAWIGDMFACLLDTFRVSIFHGFGKLHVFVLVHSDSLPWNEMKLNQHATKLSWCWSVPHYCEGWHICLDERSHCSCVVVLVCRYHVFLSSACMRRPDSRYGWRSPPQQERLQPAHCCFASHRWLCPVGHLNRGAWLKLPKVCLVEGAWLMPGC